MKRLLSILLACLVSACAVDPVSDTVAAPAPALATAEQAGTGSSGGNPEIAAIWLRTAVAADGDPRWITPPVLHIDRVRLYFGKGPSCPASSARTIHVGADLAFDGEQPIRLRGTHICAVEILPSAVSPGAILSGSATTHDGTIAVGIGRTHGLRIAFSGTERARVVELDAAALLDDIDASDYRDRALSEAVTGADRARVLRNIPAALHVHALTDTDTGTATAAGARGDDPSHVEAGSVTLWPVPRAGEPSAD